MTKKIEKEKDERQDCDISGCKEKADYNLQNWYHLYTCNKDGSYDEQKDWEGDSNEHYCEKHAEEEGII